MPAAPLHPDTPPLRTHALPVGDGHVLHVQEHGHADGLPALVLHGGPGSGCSPLLRRFFDPARFRVICLDQRGAGLSTPRGAIVHNTTDDLLGDLRRLREHLGIASWLVVGGSWGAALAVAHAAAEPQVVAGLVLRSSFLARAEDIAAFFTPVGPGERDAWERFAAVAPPEARAALLPFLADGFEHSPRDTCLALARAWWQWEQFLATGAKNTPAPTGAALDAQVDRYRVQSHYLAHRCWLATPSLLERCVAVPPVPTLLLHGRQDRICPPEGAVTLHRHLPGSELRWLDGAGHDPAHPAMAAAMVEALDRWAARACVEAAR